jgi:hypothetical protein
MAANTVLPPWNGSYQWVDVSQATWIQSAADINELLGQVAGGFRAGTAMPSAERPAIVAR